jgi:hypothetical protein
LVRPGAEAAVPLIKKFAAFKHPDNAIPANWGCKLGVNRLCGLSGKENRNELRGEQKQLSLPAVAGSFVLHFNEP